MDIIIKEAQIHDIPALFKLNNELNGVGLSTVESMKESLENNKNEIIFVAVCDNEVVGFICGQLYSSKTGLKNFNAQKLYEKCGYEYKRKAYLKNTLPCS